MNTRKIILLLFITAFSFNISAQLNKVEKSFRKDADVFYEKTLEAVGSVPGVSIVVVKDEKIIYQKGFGYAALDEKLPMTPKTNFYIASSTKSFTGLLASILDKEGIISLDAPLTKYFPEINFIPELEADKVKIRDLFTHTSGISNSPLGFRVAYSGDHNFELRKSLLSHSTVNSVGRGNFSYTNVGYNIYAIILEKVTGKTWKDWLYEKVFTPLDMKRTTAYISKAKNKKWPMALPYIGISDTRIEEAFLKKQDNTMQAAGGLITTVEDIGNWLKVQINNGVLNKKRIFDEDLILSNRLPLVNGSTSNAVFKGDNYGMGWQLGKYKNEKVVWHFGGFPGFLTHISYMPEKKIGVAVFVNEGIAGNRLKDLFAAYAYDYLVYGDTANEAFKKQSEETIEQLNQLKIRIAEHQEMLAERTWKLSKSFKAYEGVYTNDLLGKIAIKLEDEKLHVYLGNMYCIATPYKEVDTIRVELITGSGQGIIFSLEDNEVKGLTYEGLFFGKEN